MLSIAAEMKKLDERDKRIQQLKDEAAKKPPYNPYCSCQDGSCGCCYYCTGEY